MPLPDITQKILIPFNSMRYKNMLCSVFFDFQNGDNYCYCLQIWALGYLAKSYFRKPKSVGPNLALMTTRYRH